MNQFLFIFLIAAVSSLIPMACFTALVWWMDRYEREPVKWVVCMFCCGAVGAPILVWLLYPVVYGMLKWCMHEDTVQFVSIMILVPVLEETVKAVPLFIFRRNNNFDNSTDGIVYGSAIGFGFGMTENMLSFVNSYFQEEPIGILGTVVVRTLFSATLHAFGTGLIGYFLGRINFQRVRSGPNICYGLLVAMFFHIGWNSVIVYARLTSQPHLIRSMFIAFVVIFFGLIILMQKSLYDESIIIRRELSEEAVFGLIPADHVFILPSYSKRTARGWVDEKIKKRYIELATQLAFAKHRLKISRGEKTKTLIKETEFAREEIRELLRIPFETENI